MSKKMIFRLLFLCLFLLPPAPLSAQDGPAPLSAFRATNYPLPRFVSLGSDKIYVRSGPGQKYPIKFIFQKSGLPVEVILEYEAWRKIRDHEGAEGWVHKSLLSGKRTGLIRADDLVSVYQKPKADSRLAAYVEPLALGMLDECDGNWCQFESGGYKGWIERKYIWGVYEGENFD